MITNLGPIPCYKWFHQGSHEAQHSAIDQSQPRAQAERCKVSDCVVAAVVLARLIPHATTQVSSSQYCEKATQRRHYYRTSVGRGCLPVRGSSFAASVTCVPQSSCRRLPHGRSGPQDERYPRNQHSTVFQVAIDTPSAARSLLIAFDIVLAQKATSGGIYDEEGHECESSTHCL